MSGRGPRWIKEIKRSRLPKEYQEIEYVETSGTQYIDTGFKPNQNTRVIMDVKINGGGSAPTPFGAWNGTLVGAFIALQFNGGVRIFYGNAYADSALTVDNGRHTWDMDKNAFYLDTVLYATASASSFSGLFNMYLFQYNSAGGAPAAMNAINCLMYSCKVYDDGTLARDFVPCVRNADNTVGLYDLVNGLFYTNVGSGQLAAGPVV